MGYVGLSEETGSFDEGNVVHHRQRLQWRIRSLLADNADFSSCRVKVHHGWGRNRASPIRVQRTSIEIVALVLLVSIIGDGLPDS